MSYPQIFDWEKIVKIGLSARYIKKLRQSDLAELSGLSKPIIVNFEKNRTNIKVDNIFKILTALDIKDTYGDNNFNIMNWSELVQTATIKRYSMPITKSKLAQQAGICLNIVIDFEKYKTNMRLSQVIKILTVLELTNSSIAGNKDNQGKTGNRINRETN